MLHGFIAEPGQGLAYLCGCLFLCQVAFGIERVREGDELFLQRDGEHIPMGERQTLLLYSFSGETGSRVPFTHEGVFG